MAVWLSCGPVAVTFDNDIVPREAMQRLVSLEHLLAEARVQADALRAAAQAEAQETRAEAQAEARTVAEKARREASAVTRLAYAQGRRDGLRHWHAISSQQRREAATLLGSQRERLAGMVAQATASLLQGTALELYLDAALEALDRLAEESMTLSVTVHPDDCATAQRTVERLRPHWRDGTVVRLLPSAAVARGSCICESAGAYVDASLSLQLATLRQAALGALDDLQLPDDVAPPPAPAPALSPALPLRGADPPDPFRLQAAPAGRPGRFGAAGALFGMDDFPGEEGEEGEEDEEGLGLDGDGDRFEDLFDDGDLPSGAAGRGGLGRAW